MKDLSDAVARLQEVVATSGLVEMNKLVHGTIETLKERSPYGMFDDVLIRHLWDEFCWNYQEGPGLFNDEFEDVVMAFIDTALVKAGTHALVCMTAYSQDQLDSSFSDDEREPGTIDKESISRACLEKIKVAAGIRNLDLLGPERCYVIGGYITANSPVFSSYDTDSLAEHIDELIDPDGDLDSIADEIAECFLSGLSEESGNPDLDDFFERYGDEIHAMIKTKEIIPALEDVRSELLAELDG
jgi:hypothetical protein